MLKRFTRAASSLMLALTSALAFANSGTSDPFPEKPVRLVVTFGGGAAELARLVAQKMTDELGQQVVVDVQPAAAGVVATSQVARSAPDGYTVLVGSNNSMIFRPLTMKQIPYDPLKDFAPLSMFSVPALALAVNSKLGINSIQELAQYMQKHPGQAFVGVWGVPSIGSLSALQLREAVPGLNFQPVPYRDEGAAVIDTIGGQVPAVIVTPSSLLGPAQQGTLKVLAVLADERRPRYENVPTIGELLPGFKPLRPFTGFWVPVGTPDNRVEILNKAITSALNDKDIQQQVNNLGSFLKASTPQQLEQALRAETELMSAALKRAGVEPE